MKKKLEDRTEISQDDLYNRILGDDELLGAITALLGWFEDISIAVQEHHADEKILYKSLSFLIPWANKNLAGYIEAERDRENGTAFYCEMRKLVDSWEDGRYLSTGEKVEIPVPQAKDRPRRGSGDSRPSHGDGVTPAARREPATQAAGSDADADTGGHGAGGGVG